MLSHKSRRVWVVAILLVFLAGFAGYYSMGPSTGPPRFLIWIEENVFGYTRAPKVQMIVVLDSDSMTVDERPEIEKGH
jgi:hypothetical protein